MFYALTNDLLSFRISKKAVATLGAVSQLAFPFVVLADLSDTITQFQGYALQAINFLLVLATLVFLWGILKYITAGGDAAKVAEARSYIIWGIVGLAVMASVWAIISYLKDTLGIEGGDNTIPTY
jgi:fumarate reductase subunit D